MRSGDHGRASSVINYFQSLWLFQLIRVSTVVQIIITETFLANLNLAVQDMIVYDYSRQECNE